LHPFLQLHHQDERQLLEHSIDNLALFCINKLSTISQLTVSFKLIPENS